jgi:hypothetical protein
MQLRSPFGRSFRETDRCGMTRKATDYLGPVGGTRVSLVPALMCSATQGARIEEDEQEHHDNKERGSNHEPSRHDAVTGLNRCRDLLHVPTSASSVWFSYRGADDGKHQILSCLGLRFNGRRANSWASRGSMSLRKSLARP